MSLDLCDILLQHAHAAVPPGLLSVEIAYPDATVPCVPESARWPVPPGTAKLSPTFDQAAWLSKVIESACTNSSGTDTESGPSPPKKPRIKKDSAADEQFDWFSVLPDELLEKILGFVEIGSEDVIELVCSRWKRCLPHRDLSKYHRRQPQDLVLSCCVKGYHRLLLWACQHGAPLDIECSVQAAFRGDVLSLELLEAAGAFWDERVVRAAVKNYQIITVKWLLHRDPPSPIDSKALAAAAANGDLATLDWLRKYAQVDRSVSEAAAQYGHISVLDYLYEDDLTRRSMSPDMYIAAVVGGHVKVLDWLYDKGLLRNRRPDWKWAGAAPIGNLEILSWVRAHRMDVPSALERKEAVTICIQNGNLEVLQRLHELWGAYSRFKFKQQHAMFQKLPLQHRGRNAEMFHWLCDHDYEWSLSCADIDVHNAVKIGDLELLKAMDSRGWKLHPKLLKTASRNLQILEWLLKRGVHKTAVAEPPNDSEKRLQPHTFDVDMGVTFVWSSFQPSQLYARAAQQNDFDTIRLLRKYDVPWDLDEDEPLSTLLERGEWGMAFWVHDHGYPWKIQHWRYAFSWFIFTNARGNAGLAALTTLNRIREEGCPFGPNVYEFAFHHYSFDLVKWLLAQNCPFDHNTIFSCIHTQSLKMLKLFPRQSPSLRSQSDNETKGVETLWSAECIERVLKRPQSDDDTLSWVRWLRQQGAPWPPKVLRYAYPRTALIKKLYTEEGAPLCSSLFVRAIGWHVVANADTLSSAEESQAFIAWLVRNQCPMTEEAYHRPIREKNVTMIQWLYKKGCPWSGDTFKRAVETGSWYLVRWMLKTEPGIWKMEQNDADDDDGDDDDDDDDDDDALPPMPDVCVEIEAEDDNDECPFTFGAKRPNVSGYR